jgi:hypothetical protein
VPGCTRALAGKGFLLLKKNAGDSTGGVLFWKWAKGPATFSEFGLPVVSTDYRLCVYDGADLLRMNMFVPAGGICARGKPCWKANGMNDSATYKYKRKDGAFNGITAILLRAPQGTASILVKGRGPFLSMPRLPLVQTPSPARVQLVNSTTSTCWEATYSGPALTAPAATEKFKDTND